MARTATLPGIASETNSELTELAQKYIVQRNARMVTLKAEVELKEQLIAMMESLKLKTYYDEEENLSIALETKTKVKVKIGAEEEEDE
jgi:hypothetical protein